MMELELSNKATQPHRVWAQCERNTGDITKNIATRYVQRRNQSRFKNTKNEIYIYI